MEKWETGLGPPESWAADRVVVRLGSKSLLMIEEGLNKCCCVVLRGILLELLMIDFQGHIKLG